MSRRRSAAHGAAFTLAAILTCGTEALAVHISVPRLQDVRAAEGRISFRQPDGRYTVLDLATGEVVQRGGKVPQGWPRPQACALPTGNQPCAFPTGVFTMGDYTTEFRSTGRTGQGTWEALNRRPWHVSPTTLWAVDDKLLIEATTFGISMLECIESRSGRSLWAYLYPSYSRGGLDSSTVTHAREQLQTAATIARDYGAGTLPTGTTPETFVPYAGSLVLDPDPYRQRVVRLTIVAGWVTLAVVATAMLLAWRSGRHRVTVFGVMVLALLILTFGRVDFALFATLWIALILAARVAGSASPGKGHRALLILVVSATALVFIIEHLLGRLER